MVDEVDFSLLAPRQNKIDQSMHTRAPGRHGGRVFASPIQLVFFAKSVKGAHVFKQTSVIALGIAMFGATEVGATSIVLNGGFETGDFTGWSLSGGSTFCAPFVATNGQSACGVVVGPPHSGTYYAVLGNNSTDWFLDQTLTTIGGQTYNLSFWLSNNDVGFGITPNDFSVSWNGTQVYSAVNLGPFAYTQFSFPALIATSGSTTLRIGGFRHDPGYFGLDDISVEAVPEPASLVLFGTGLVGLLRLRRSIPRNQPPVP